MWHYAGFRIDNVQRDKNILYFKSGDRLIKYRAYPSINAAKRVVREWQESNRG